MIVSCPSCGTHFKRPPAAPEAARARCGRCDAAFDLTVLRPYRIRPVPVVPDVAARPGAGRPTIGLDEPGLASAVAAGGPPPGGGSAMTWRIEAHEESVPSAPAPDTWDETEPLPSIPEMAFDPALEDLPPVAEAGDLPGPHRDGAAEATPADATPGPTGASAYLLWALGGAILGTGASWTLGGTTSMGLLAGGGAGLTAAWGWLRWTSRP